ncbi:class D beta-lactamase [Flavihumibacter rivuli]|uniref:penicillin-binding transpeptidase domain-containing protein n=1 Tax=Flavihumibacter rivuli TaxID=2838156 RepID=UPI001BDF5CC1|nr:penicillin-binding transpeptidase domain-containing protein [Flavihumibacter rivuli]ULQ56195.1 class D beta-lactamase [Flavihumibacter rivuli]
MRFLIGLSIVLLGLTACSPNNVKEDKSLEQFFTDNKVTGVFGLFDNGQGNFTISDKKRFRDSAYLPASTFKIVNSLIGIETGRVKDDSTVIPWDGKVRSIENWNQDLSMYRAFRYSAVPWFQELARRIGKDTMQRWLDTLGYASRYGRATINKIDTFWLDNSIKITPDEQLGLVKKLYFDQLPFQRRTHEIVRRMMLFEDNANYKLSYKTGWGKNERAENTAWIIGWIEENKHPYFFVLQVSSKDPDAKMDVIRMNILKGILKQMGFMEGKK